MRAERPADWLSAAEALRAILGGVAPLEAEERPLLDAVGGVLAEEVSSTVDLPPWDNSAMDGFAVRAEDVRGASSARPVVLRVVDDVPAGRFAARPVGPGEAIRIMTGAPVPDGADGVIRVEHTDGGSGIGTAEGRVAILSDADAGRNVRPRGEDVRRGSVVLRAGAVLRAAEIGVAASLGRARLRVVRRPVVAVLASGDELVPVEEFAEVEAGRRIVSSNSYSLAAALTEAGLEARVLGIAPDAPEGMREQLERARGCDALITTAGISVGEHDHVRRVMAELDTEVAFWRVRIRPGSAMAFGRVGALGGIPWFGLPGNPVSTGVTFELFVRPALMRMCGRTRIHSPWRYAVLDDAYPMRGELMHFPRVSIRREEDRHFHARLTGSQSSGVSSSLAAANGLALIPPGPGPRAGHVVRVVWIGGAPLVEEPPFGDDDC
jgi:molybdopterin molybdotransferase